MINERYNISKVFKQRKELIWNLKFYANTAAIFSQMNKTLSFFRFVYLTEDCCSVSSCFLCLKTFEVLYIYIYIFQIYMYIYIFLYIYIYYIYTQYIYISNVYQIRYVYIYSKDYLIFDLYWIIRYTWIIYCKYCLNRN